MAETSWRTGLRGNESPAAHKQRRSSSGHRHSSTEAHRQQNGSRQHDESKGLPNIEPHQRQRRSSSRPASGDPHHRRPSEGSALPSIEPPPHGSRSSKRLQSGEARRRPQSGDAHQRPQSGDAHRRPQSRSGDAPQRTPSRGDLPTRVDSLLGDDELISPADDEGNLERIASDTLDAMEASQPLAIRSETQYSVIPWNADEEATAMSNMLFRHLDSDCDDRLTPEELECARDLMVQTHVIVDLSGEGPCAFDLRDSISHFFEEFDADQDGYVDKQEWDNFMRSIYEVLGKRHFVRISCTWAAGFHRRFSLPRPMGPPPFKAAEDHFVETTNDSAGPAGGSEGSFGSNRILMGKYLTDLTASGLRRHHKWSTSRVAKDVHANTPVLLSIFKSGQEQSKHEALATSAFKKQVAILQRFQEPFSCNVGAEAEILNPHLCEVEPCELFIRLIDFTQDTLGRPSRDSVDRIMCVVTEQPLYTLKEYIMDLRRREHEWGHYPLSKSSLKLLVQSMLLVVAGLQAKGLVHLDLRPECFVVAHHSNLKLIDADGCVNAGDTLSVLDSTLSFTPCYCSPEWATFMSDSTSTCLAASPALQMWSLGLTLCEMVIMKPIMGRMYKSFAQNECSAEEAGLLFMEWLSCLNQVNLPQALVDFDAELSDFLLDTMMVIEPHERQEVSQCLLHPYITGIQPTLDRILPERVEIDDRGRLLDTAKKILLQGTLWKLNTESDPDIVANWLERDMWVTANGSVCYFSHRENKRLVLLDASVLQSANIDKAVGGARPHSFQITVKAECDGHANEVHWFACKTSEEREHWLNVLQHVFASSHLGFISVQELHRFKLEVRNHRKPIARSLKDNFQPILRGHLWKLKTGGELHTESDWFERDTWLSKNGSLVYWSQREDRELIYHTSADVRRSSVQRVSNGQACKLWVFELYIPPNHDFEVSPSFFAAQSMDNVDQWVRALGQFSCTAETEPCSRKRQRKPSLGTGGFWH